MSACLTLQGYSIECDKGMGGIRKVYLVERAGLTFTGTTAGEIKELTLSGDYTGYTYDFLRDSSNFSFPAIGDGLSARVHWQHNLTLVFARISNSIRNEMYELSKGEICAIVQDWNDVYWFLGYHRGLYATAGAGGVSGSKLEDPHGYTAVFISDEPQPAYTIDISATSEVDARILAAFGF